MTNDERMTKFETRRDEPRNCVPNAATSLVPTKGRSLCEVWTPNTRKGFNRRERRERNDADVTEGNEGNEEREFMGMFGVQWLVIAIWFGRVFR
jgi:hypothetical protein